MKTKLIAFMLLAGASAFAQTRFSIQIGGGTPGYYAPRAYYGAQPYYRSNGYGYGYGYSNGYGYGGGAGYWGENPDRAHRRAEWQGMRNHHETEREMYGDSWELRQHQAEERQQLRREQRHESHGDYDAADGPAHGSARDGMYYRQH